VADATGLPYDAVWRRSSDLFDDGVICWARDASGAVITRVWHRTRKAQQARRLGTEPAPASLPVPPEHLEFARQQLAPWAAWMRACGMTTPARLIERAIRELGQ
jgi:hypothetical protein